MTVPFLRPSYFLWLAVPVTFAATTLLVTNTLGLPHLVWSYTWIDDGKGYGSFSTRHYTRCTYVGPYGQVTVRPVDGRCVWFRFVKRVSEAG